MPRNNSDTFKSDTRDAGLGFAGLLAVFVLAMFTGGFSFIQPWILWIVVVCFLVGFSRKVERGERLWRRILLLDVAWLSLSPLALLSPRPWLAVFVFFAPGIPTAAGLYARRLVAMRKAS